MPDAQDKPGEPQEFAGLLTEPWVSYSNLELAALVNNIKNAHWNQLDQDEILALMEACHRLDVSR